MADETTFFNSGNVVVTNARFIVGAQTFAMRGITSVEGVEQSPSYVGPAILILFGLFMALGFTIGSILLGILGVGTLALGVWLATLRKPMFSVVLRTAGGEVTAYESPNRSQISQIIEALNQAVISQGQG